MTLANVGVATGPWMRPVLRFALSLLSSFSPLQLLPLPFSASPTGVSPKDVSVAGVSAVGAALDCCKLAVAGGDVMLAFKLWNGRKKCNRITYLTSLRRGGEGGQMSVGYKPGLAGWALSSRFLQWGLEEQSTAWALAASFCYI